MVAPDARETLACSGDSHMKRASTRMLSRDLEQKACQNQITLPVDTDKAGRRWTSS